MQCGATTCPTPALRSGARDLDRQVGRLSADAIAAQQAHQEELGRVRAVHEQALAAARTEAGRVDDARSRLERTYLQSAIEVERLIAEAALLQENHQRELANMRAAHQQELAAARLAAGRNPRHIAGVQSMTTYRRPQGRFQADVQGFRRGGESDVFPEDGWNEMMEEQLRLREQGV